LCALLWRPLSLIGIGAVAKAYLYHQNGWSLGYSSAEWTENGISFADFVVSDEQGFLMSAPRAIASFRKKRIEIDSPRLTVGSSIQWTGGETDWAIAATEGTIEGEGIEAGRFSFDRNPDRGHLRIAWGDSSVLVEGEKQNGSWTVDISLQQFQVSRLRRWIGERWSGFVGGKLQIVSDHGLWTHSQGFLEGKEIGCAAHGENIAFSIEWEGPLVWSRACTEGRLRFSLLDGTLLAPRSKVKRVSGDLSYTGETGAKWGFEGDLEGESLQWAGRGFFHSLQGQWLESEAKWGNSSLLVQEREEKEERLWEGEFNNLRTPLLILMQDLASKIDSRFSEWSILGGTASGSFHAAEPKSGEFLWKIDEFQGTNLVLQSDEAAASCKEVIYRENGFSFAGADVSARLPNGKMVSGKSWSGSGNLQEKQSAFSGSIDDWEVSAETRGEIADFQAHVAVQGPLTGEFFLDGGWDGESLQILLSDADVAGLRFRGKGFLDDRLRFSWQSDRFSGPLEPLLRFLPIQTRLSGRIEAVGNGFSAEGTFDAWDWSLQARIEDGEMPLFSSARLEKLQLEIGADREGFSCYDARGVFIWGKEFPFYCPVFQTSGSFDLRLEGESWDILRLAGASSGGKISVDEKKSRCMAQPIRSGNFELKEGMLQNLQMTLDLSWKSFSSFFPEISWLRKAPLDGSVSLSVSYDWERGFEIQAQSDTLQWEKEAIDLRCALRQEGSQWKMLPSRIADFSLEGCIGLDEGGVRLERGRGKWREELEAEVSGRFDSFKKWSLHLSNMRLDLSGIAPLTSRFGWPLEKIEGILEGSGMVSWNGKLESDFDFAASYLKAGSLVVQNRTPLHLYYSSDEGVMFRGLDLAVLKPDLEMPWIDCKIGLLRYDANHSLWKLTHSHFHLPADFFSALKQRPSFLEAISLRHELDFIADIECSSDFSAFSFSMKEGFIPFQGEMRHIQNLHLYSDPWYCTAAFDLFHQSQSLKIALEASLDETISGSLRVQDELLVDWTYGDKFSVRAIEGYFGGAEASFHSEGDSMVGSARLDLNLLSEWIPPRIAQVFYDLEMGKGYELMGRMTIGSDGFSFKGILSGKQLELFDFQLRTLMAQVEIRPDFVRIYDVKISDSAGVMKIDEIVAKGEEESPWTISIPHLIISELRPSLLQRVGETPGTISPLVVRQLKIEDFKGLLEESRTYTAKGELHFINSYKREHTLLDVPSDVLSRIVGLDLDLLIPVCGTLRYELKDGFFRLTELLDSYSENKRSEFFLAESPTMDLDGNLKILIKMKQFVLFKFTESFLISIDGKLDDPQFHLQKKKRFLGL
jgi:hypothetical protein